MLLLYSFRFKKQLPATGASWKSGNARGYARRAVAIADATWLAKQSDRSFRGDAMAHLQRIQRDHSLPVSTRNAAERLSTAVPKKDSALFSSDPMGDARIIIGYLFRNYAFEVQDSPRRVA